MTKPDTTTPVNKSTHFASSLFATASTQIPRVLLNRANQYPNPIATIIGSYPFFLSGLGLNLLRGSLATGTQSWAKHTVHEYAGFWPSILAASLCGTTVATFIETAFIRKTTMAAMQAGQYSLWRFSPTLSSFYFLREMGFSLAVLAKQDFSPTGQYAAVLGGAYVTATMHKMAVMEATRDSMEKAGTLPKFTYGGVLTALRNIAQGGVYTHPALAVPFQNPANLLAKIANFAGATCGGSMLFFRLLYLVTFEYAYSSALKQSPSLLSKVGFFKADAQSRVQDSNEDHQHQPKAG